ncbi:hypothetical protein J437_LFUL002865 [Ladona fulva]|uniref:Major facilitator superfamily (MFS) profile domain-containing protein n=1 Tax=Ladona fulva TaxID=123851 RepID=A0A8K0K0L4_LADFU|nr:hypothetical protein J437_LFUL002865 [Ladona fulva]
MFSFKIPSSLIPLPLVLLPLNASLPSPTDFCSSLFPSFFSFKTTPEHNLCFALFRPFDLWPRAWRSFPPSFRRRRAGLNTSLVPMYISEIAPLNLRGGLGTVNQLAVTAGLLISQVLGIEQILGTDEGWPVLLGLAICPAILQLILLPVCPESPRYLLITKQWEEEARKALRRLRASNQVEEDIEEMRAEERAQQAEATISMTELICSPTLRSPLIIGVVMQLSQQLSGINAVLYYSTGLFVSSGLTEESAKFATIGIGAIMVGMTLVSIPLMDRTGRRTLHLYGLGGMFIFSIFITISFLIKHQIVTKSQSPQCSITAFNFEFCLFKSRSSSYHEDYLDYLIYLDWKLICKPLPQFIISNGLNIFFVKDRSIQSYQ